MRARRAAIDFVRESLAPSDLAAVATFGPSGIQVLVSFTSDRSQLARAITTLGVVDQQRLRDPLSLAYDLGFGRWGPGIGPPPDGKLDGFLRDLAQRQSRSEQALYRQRVDGFLAGLEQLARLLDSVQGRKQLVLLSAGFDSTVLGGAQGQEAAETTQAVLDGRIWDVQSDSVPDPKREVPAGAGSLQAAETIAKGLSGGPIGLRAVVVPYRDAAGALSLSVVLEIDARALLGGGGSKELGLEVFGYAFDGEGRVLDAFGLARTLDLAVVRPSLEAKGLQVVSSLAATAGPADLRFAVRDKATGRGGSLRVRLEVPAFEPGRIVLSPPLAMDDPRARLVLPTPSRALPGLAIPFRLADTPFTVEALPALSNGAEREVCVMAWAGEKRYGGGPPLEVAAEVVDPAGSARSVALAGPPRVVEDADGVERYVLTLRPQGIPAGQHALRVRFRDPATGTSETSETAVRVE